MAGFRVGFNGKYIVEHNNKQFTPCEEVVLLEGFKVYALATEQVKFEKLPNTTFTIIHMFAENGRD